MFNKLAKLNNLNIESKQFSLPEIVQESYKLSYRAKEKGNESLLKLAESHLDFLKKNPSATDQLCENLTTLLELEKLGESAVLEEDGLIVVNKRRPRRPVDPKERAEAKLRWKKNRGKMLKALAKFRKSARGKAFYRALGKFNSRMKEGADLTLSESLNLFKAGNSALTHLAVELEHNPEFQEAFNEASAILSDDLQDLLEFIREKSVPDASLLESFQDFHSILSDPEDDESTDSES